MSEGVLRSNLINKELLENPERIKIIAEQQFELLTRQASTVDGRLQTPFPSKDINEVYELIRNVILDYHTRENKNSETKLDVVYENPDRRIGILSDGQVVYQTDIGGAINLDFEIISISLESRNPGMFSQGRPGESEIRNRKPILRQIVEDPENPGYKRAIFGQWYDNEITLTCWARTNKEANARSLWLENVMEEYAWYFSISGVNRLMYQRRRGDKTTVINGNRFYGRPLDYFVRTEKITETSQKKLEEIVINMALRLGTY